MELCWITATGVRTVSDDEARENAGREDGVLWVHCDHTDAAGMALLTELVPVRPPDLNICHLRSPVPLLRAYPDHFFSAMNGLVVIQLDPVRAEALLGNLFAVRHDLQTIRTNAAQTHELYSHLSDQVEAEAGLLPIDPRVLRELRQAYGPLRNTTDLEREYLQEVLDLFQTRVSTELNRFVRKITAFGTIAIAWTVIPSVYGMNFIRMPELQWHFGYPAVLGLMAVIGVVLVVFFRRRGWL